LLTASDNYILHDSNFRWYAPTKEFNNLDYKLPAIKEQSKQN
jgi:hypothetical protein